MSSEVHKHIEEALNKNKNLFNAQVISFPNDEKIDQSKDIETKKNTLIWNIGDKSNNDQFRAVVGICFMFGALIVMGLYSNFF